VFFFSLNSIQYNLIALGTTEVLSTVNINMATNLVVLGENAARINVKVNPNMTVLKASALHYLIFKQYSF